MALSYVWLGLPGGHFQSDGGFRVAAATTRRRSSLGEPRALWPQNLKRWFSVYNNITQTEYNQENPRHSQNAQNTVVPEIRER